MTPIKTWEELTICDNFLFQKVMQNESLCKRLIEKLLNIKVEEITYIVKRRPSTSILTAKAYASTST